MRPVRRTTPPTLRVLNWSWGEDSSTTVLLAEHGVIPKYDVIICADTQNEPEDVYATIEWLMPFITVPVYRVTTGDLAAEVLAAAQRHEAGEPMTAGHAGQPPFWVKNDPNTDYATAVSGGKLWRKCTHDYKVVPIRRKIRQLLHDQYGYNLAGRLPKGVWVEQAISFPREELGRTFCSDVQWITNTFPLIMLGMRKHDCREWRRKHGYPVFLPKSACKICPLHDNAYWRRMRDTKPQEWQEVCDYEVALQHGKLPGVRGTPYLHRSMVPLPMAPIDKPDTGQEEMFCYACNT